MTIPIKIALIGIALATTISVASAVGKASQHSGSHASVQHTAPAWNPDPKLLRKLAPEQVERGFGLRPVADYTFNSEIQHGNDEYMWQGNPRADNTAPLLAMIVGELPPKGGQDYTSKDVLLTYVQDMQNNLENLDVSTSETGRIGKQQFLRVRWTANEPGHSEQTRGFLYITIFPRQFVILAGQDRLSHANSTFPLLHAACQTFRKK